MKLEEPDVLLLILAMKKLQPCRVRYSIEVLQEWHFVNLPKTRGFHRVQEGEAHVCHGTLDLAHPTTYRVRRVRACLVGDSQFLANQAKSLSLSLSFWCWFFIEWGVTDSETCLFPALSPLLSYHQGGGSFTRFFPKCSFTVFLEPFCSLTLVCQFKRPQVVLKNMK